MTRIQLVPNGGSESGLYQSLADIDENILTLNAGVAFVTTAGLDAFRSATNFQGPSTDENWIVAINDGITQPEALQRLYDNAQSEIRVANGNEALDSGGLNTSVHFHPKVLWFERDDFIDILAGSSNLTQRGFFSNWEMGLFVQNIQPDEFRNIIEEYRSWWEEVWSSATPVSQEFIDEYETVRQSYIERSPPEYLKRIEDSETALSEAKIFWSEVETVMGYTNHQYEIPMQCLNFFSRRNEEVNVGGQVHVTFIHDGQRYPNRSIRAHQNNMCRVNLPNVLGEQYDLTNYSVVLEWQENGDFRIDLIPDDESEKQLEPLKNRSRAHGQVLEMALASREYGWL